MRHRLSLRQHSPRSATARRASTACLCLIALCTLAACSRDSAPQASGNKPAAKELRVPCPPDTEPRTQVDDKFREAFCVKSGIGRHGPWHQWDTKDRLTATGTYHEGKQQGIWTKYGDNGHKTLEGELVDGKRHGAWIHFYPAGQQRSLTTYEQGQRQGLFRAWYLNGTLMSEGHFLHDLEDGWWTVWAEDGSVAKRCQMSDGIERQCESPGLGEAEQK